MKKYLASLLPIFSLGLILSTPASAQTINWGNAVGQRCVDSESSQISADWNFELGVFKPGFVPTAKNIPLWIENWTALDSADYNSKAGFFSSRARINGTELAGRQAFIWIYNKQSYQPSAEWVLMTDRDGEGDNDWVIPSASEAPTARSLSWRVSSASKVIIGGANSIVGCGKRDAIAQGKKTSTLQAFRLPATAVAVAKKRRDKADAPVVPVVALLEKVLLLQKDTSILSAE